MQRLLAAAAAALFTVTVLAACGIARIPDQDDPSLADEGGVSGPSLADEGGPADEELELLFTVDDTVLLRDASERVADCAPYLAADLEGSEEGAEQQIADCWESVSEFDGIARDVADKLAPWQDRLDELSRDHAELVEGSYGSVAMLTDAPIPHGCANEPGKAPYTCMLPYTVLLAAAEMWVDGEEYDYADRWDDEIIHA